MELQKLKKGCTAAVCLYILLAVIFYAAGGEQLHLADVTSDPVSPLNHIGELTSGMQVRQPFIAEADRLTGTAVRFSTFARVNDASLRAAVEDETGQVLAEVIFAASELEDNAFYEIAFDPPVILVSGDQYTLILESPDGNSGNAVTLWFGNTYSVARAEVGADIPEEERMILRTDSDAADAGTGAEEDMAAASETAAGTKIGIDDTVLDGKLCCSLQEQRRLLFGEYYWYGTAALGLLFVLFCLHLVLARRNGRETPALRALSSLDRSSFLMRQLISRDFKTKYKRSVLGVFWSFLNPLLTMVVQYLVFSTIFKSDIENFPLYLLTGIVCFSFFSEATNMALLSIVGNAQLISKVYVPKFIYPVTRVISSSINLLLAFIPLFAVMLATRAPIRPAAVLLPFGLVCLVVFCIGLSLLLSALMVFFRDTQFLWGVISMIWMYLTPVFYPETIIPARFLTVYHCNPLYQMIRFIRIILIDGVSPEPMAYLYCLLGAGIPLLIGIIVFRKCQDRFIFYL